MAKKKAAPQKREVRPPSSPRTSRRKWVFCKLNLHDSTIRYEQVENNNTVVRHEFNPVEQQRNLDIDKIHSLIDEIADGKHQGVMTINDPEAVKTIMSKQLNDHTRHVLPETPSSSQERTNLSEVPSIELFAPCIRIKSENVEVEGKITGLEEEGQIAVREENDSDYDDEGY